MKPRVPLGTVIEIPTAKGFAYAQYTYWHDNWGSLLRVLPGLYPSRPSNLEELVRQPHLYVSFYPLGLSLKNRSVTAADRFEIPSDARGLPLFRNDYQFDDAGRVARRRLWDGERQWSVPISAEHDHLPILELPFHNYFVHRLETGWTPEKDEGVRVAQRANSAPAAKLVPKAVTHRLYFVNRSRAEKAAEALGGPDATTRVRKAGDDVQWLVELTVTPARSRDAEAAAEAAARQFGGDYDGWETALGEPQGAR